jgi:hypothetical protein
MAEIPPVLGSNIRAGGDGRKDVDIGIRIKIAWIDDRVT